MQANYDFADRRILVTGASQGEDLFICKNEEELSISKVFLVLKLMSWNYVGTIRFLARISDCEFQVIARWKTREEFTLLKVHENI